MMSLVVVNELELNIQVSIKMSTFAQSLNFLFQPFRDQKL